jgi:choline kinase
MPVAVTILAAGMGTRLGSPLPKPLTPLRDGRTILAQQIDHVRGAFSDPQVFVVIGFRPKRLLKAQPDVLFVYNPEYRVTNTSKSLLRALTATGDAGVLWMNGDVVFDPAILTRVSERIEADTSFICVNTASVADEEVKYTVGADGYIEQLSKQVVGALGEAVGINYVSAADKPTLVQRLHEVDDQDYFERGIELAIAKDGARFEPVDISDLYAVEVDFAEDLERANRQV